MAKLKALFRSARKSGERGEDPRISLRPEPFSAPDAGGVSESPGTNGRGTALPVRTAKTSGNAAGSGGETDGPSEEEHTGKSFFKADLPGRGAAENGEGQNGDDPGASPAPGGAAQEETPDENGEEAAQDTAETEQDGGYDFDNGLSEFYTRLYSKLRSYGITSIPSFDELYGMLESFLRPSVEAAIAERNRTGRRNMAELDADAYSRGMGGSSYLSSVKAREMDAAAGDVNALEGKYIATLGDYLYKSIKSMQEMENDLKKLQMSLAGRSTGRSHSSSSSSSDPSAGDGRVHSDMGYMPYGHNKNGAYFDGVWYEGDFSYFDKGYAYEDYHRYLSGLSPSERYLFFTSSAREWRLKRWQAQYDLPQVSYLDLVEAFMYSSGTASSGSSGGGKWTQMTR